MSLFASEDNFSSCQSHAPMPCFLKRLYLDLYFIYFVCVEVHTCGREDAQAHAHTEAGGGLLGILLSRSLLIPLGQGFSLNLELNW